MAYSRRKHCKLSSKKSWNDFKTQIHFYTASITTKLKNVNTFLLIILTFVLGAQKNRLSDTGLFEYIQTEVSDEK